MTGRQIAKALAQFRKAGERKAAAEYLARFTGRPVQSIYREARLHGWDSGRSERADKGNGYHHLSREQLLAVMAVLERARTKGKVRMPLWRAIQTAENSGIIEPGALTEAALSRFMRAEKMSKRAMNEGESHIYLRSLYPNHTHMMDPTPCDQFYLKDDGRIIPGAQPPAYYKGKENTRRDKIWRWLITDHCSGAFFWRYYLAPGENTADALEFCYKSWVEKDDPAMFPFHGAPEILVTDNAPWAKSTPFQNVMAALGVRHIRNLPYNARAKGAVETLHGWISAVFETGLRHDPATNLEELNAKAFDEAILLNGGRIHKRHKCTRSAFWSYHVPQEKLRTPPDYAVYRSLAMRKAEYRTVGEGLLISYKGQSYKVPDPDLMKRRVRVIENIYEPGVVTVTTPAELGGRSYVLSPLPRDAAGFFESAATIGEEFKSNKEKTVTKRIKEMGKVTLPKIIPFGHAAERIEKVAFLPRKGRSIDVEAAGESPRLPFLDAVLKIKERLGRPVSIEENRRLKGRYGESIPAADIEALAGELRDGEEQAHAR